MSRRRHGRPHHRARSDATEPPAEAAAAPTTSSAEPDERRPEPRARRPRDGGTRVTGGPPPADGVVAESSAVGERPGDSGAGLAAEAEADPQTGVRADRQNGRTAGGPHVIGNGAAALGRRCTTAQLRRFIKSRPYIPMHELRRRFGIEGLEDDVTPVRLDVGVIFVGLPEGEGRMLGELMRGGDIGYELSLDPLTPIIVGVYPMRPISRS